MPVTKAAFRVSGLPDPGFDGLEIDLGPTHPSTAGLLWGTIVWDGDTVDSIDAQPGALHRGAEVIMAARNYRQALGLANRHDWQAPFFGEWALARLVEDALGVDVPERARWIRVALAEHTRVASHLAYLSFVGHHQGDARLATHGVRELLRERTAELTGNRLHPMAVRLGGIACEPTQAWVAAERDTLEEASRLAERIAEAIEGWGVGVALVSRANVDAYGLAGPVARASGVSTDLRLSRPDAAYTTCADLLCVDAPTTGDAHARFRHLAAEVVASAAIVGRVLDGLPGGPLVAHLPKVVKLPEGDWTASVEAPLGRAGVVVTSRGEKTPWRLRLRTASFAHVSAWPAVLPGTGADDLELAMASLPWVAGDLDK
ncbi:MAG: NADH-quinone oxidoreductase subunit D [Actinomycetes bacterium]